MRRHPKDINNFLKTWFYVNIHYPYPNKLMKKHLSLQTGLTIEQITTFYINERKRNKSYKQIKLLKI
tara:strand:+ start:11675 stop:11875 length:201 start_codon:yes stop_codon:yes gene_type:complete